MQVGGLGEVPKEGSGQIPEKKTQKKVTPETEIAKTTIGQEESGKTQSIKAKGISATPEPQGNVASIVDKLKEKALPQTVVSSGPEKFPGAESLQQRKEAYRQQTVEKKLPEREQPDVKKGHLEETKKELEASKGKQPEPVMKEAVEVRKGLVEEVKSELGQRVPEFRLGGNTKVTEQEIQKHRKPEVGGKKYSDTALTEKYVKDKLTELTNEFKLQHGGRDPKKAEASKLKEQAQQFVYDTYLKDPVDQGFYNPKVIAAEIKRVLEVGDEIPPHIDSQESAMKAIGEELDKFNIPVFEQGRKQSQVLTNELRKHLEKDIAKTMKQYKSVYPEKSWEDAFVLCRDMARAAVYQVIFDKTSFTGSDHGVLHIHHNSKNGDHMHKHMDEGDVSDKAKLLSRIMHFYHDIGYSVGETSFAAKKDHPFIGAAFIDANKEYFEHYLGADETNILKKSILYHAIVSFDSKVGDDLAMVRFTTSNSDACAVSADQKTQSFWREHPETILSLAKLKQFLTMYPEYGGFDKLANANIMKNPEKVFKLKDDKTVPLDLSEKNFVNPLDYRAWSVFSTVRKELMDVANRQELPEEEKKAFLEAIENNFNSLSGEIVLAQYGAELQDVSVEKNPDPNGPKYLPAVEVAPSPLYSILQSAYSTELAGKNIRKVLNEEYGAPLEEIDRALDQVGSKGADKKTVKSDVAKLTIAKQTKAPVGKLQKVEAKIKEMYSISVPIETRLEVNKTVSIIKDMSTGKKTLTNFTDSLEDLYAVIGGSEVEQGIDKILNDFAREVATTTMSKERYDAYIVAIRTQCSNAKEWEMMGLEAPSINV